MKNRNMYREYSEITEAEVQKLLPLAQKGDIEARNKIIESMYKLIHHINKRFGGTEDGFQSGIFGIIEAIEKFDLKKETKLSSYASFWIEMRIRKWYDRENYKGRSYHLIEVTKGYKKLLGEQPELKDDEIIKKLRINQRVLNNIRKCNQVVISLDFRCLDNDCPLSEIIGTDKSSEEINKNIIRVYINEILEECCTEKEKNIIRGLYFDEYSEMELASILGVTKQTVNFGKQKALLKMRARVWRDENQHN